jgi:hypothetical protein
MPWVSLGKGGDKGGDKGGGHGKTSICSILMLTVVCSRHLMSVPEVVKVSITSLGILKVCPSGPMLRAIVDLVQL